MCVNTAVCSDTYSALTQPFVNIEADDPLSPITTDVTTAAAEHHHAVTAAPLVVDTRQRCMDVVEVVLRETSIGPRRCVCRREGLIDQAPGSVEVCRNALAIPPSGIRILLCHLLSVAIR